MEWDEIGYNHMVMHSMSVSVLVKANMSLRGGLSRSTLYLHKQVMGHTNLYYANASVACSSSPSDSGKSAGATKPVPDIKTY